MKVGRELLLRHRHEAGGCCDDRFGLYCDWSLSWCCSYERGWGDDLLGTCGCDQLLFLVAGGVDEQELHRLLDGCGAGRSYCGCWSGVGTGD